jgi:hypothetical protein
MTGYLSLFNPFIKSRNDEHVVITSNRPTYRKLFFNEVANQMFIRA